MLAVSISFTSVLKLHRKFDLKWYIKTGNIFLNILMSFYLSIIMCVSKNIIVWQIQGCLWLISFILEYSMNCKQFLSIVYIEFCANSVKSTLNNIAYFHCVSICLFFLFLNSYSVLLMFLLLYLIYNYIMLK